MKSCIKHFIASLGVVFFNPVLVNIFTKIYSLMRFGGWRSKFGACGRNSFIQTPFLFHLPENIYIGDNFSAGRGTMLQTWGDNHPRLEIGNNVSVQWDCQISCANEVKIGDGCLFGNNVFITDNFHGSTDTLTTDASSFFHRKNIAFFTQNVKNRLILSHKSSHFSVLMPP